MTKTQKLFVIALSIFTYYANADETIMTLQMEENSFAPRTGTINIIIPTVNTSPFTGDPDFSPLETGLLIDAVWEKICSSNVALAGGHFNGWLLGPLVDGTLDLDIDDLHDEYREIFGLGPGNTATNLFASLAGDFFGTPTGGSAQRFNCSGGTDNAEFGFLLIFLWPNATTFADKGFYVGDVFYQTEIGTQHYFLYHSTPLM